GPKDEMDQLIDRIMKATWAAKLGALAGIAVLVTGLNWYLVTDDLQTQIVRSEAQRKKLEGEHVDKQQTGDSLNEFRRRKEELEARLAAALQELPQDKATDELPRQMNDVGVKAGLALTSVVPGGERKEAFSASIPVSMK